jgi:putative FmdB family regulatory protein
MPTYDYKCEACGHAFEQFQSMSAEPIRKCPSCGKLKVKRLIGTGAGLIFKGSGFYITDYRDQSYKDKAKAESGGTTGGESKGDAKTDAPAAISGDAAAAKSTGGESKAATATPAKTESKPPPAKDSGKKKGK